VAILSAVERVNPKLQSTVEAAALCKMADRGQITGGVLDRPLALDNAIFQSENGLIGTGPVPEEGFAYPSSPMPAASRCPHCLAHAHSTARCRSA
jgi:hypothetical protein